MTNIHDSYCKRKRKIPFQNQVLAMIHHQLRYCFWDHWWHPSLWTWQVWSPPCPTYFSHCPREHCSDLATSAKKWMQIKFYGCVFLAKSKWVYILHSQIGIDVCCLYKSHSPPPMLVPPSPEVLDLEAFWNFCLFFLWTILFHLKK